MTGHYRIRPTTPADLPALTLLEQEAFSDPWSSEMIAEAITAPGAVALAVEADDGALVGSVLGRVVADEAEILTIAVAPTARRRGLGRQMLDAALADLGAAGATSVWLEVRSSNHAARAMYRAAGFVAAGVRPRYYRRPTEDALILRLGPLAPTGTAGR
jgi:ribosomal-protein-alanine N-acetyltransferase